MIQLVGGRSEHWSQDKVLKLEMAGSGDRLFRHRSQWRRNEQGEITKDDSYRKGHNVPRLRKTDVGLPTIHGQVRERDGGRTWTIGGPLGPGGKGTLDEGKNRIAKNIETGETIIDNALYASGGAGWLILIKSAQSGCGRCYASGEVRKTDLPTGQGRGGVS